MNAMWGSLMAVLIVALFVAMFYWRRWERRALTAESELASLCNDLTTMGSYQVLAMRTAMPQSDREAAEHAAYGMMSELGELMTHWKAHLFYGKAFDAPYMLKECGDLLWFTTRFIKAVGFTLSEVAEANIEKLRKRYPGKYSREAALARADEQDRTAGGGQ